MPDMKSTSASVYGSRPSPGGVAWRPRAGAPAHAAVVEASTSQPAVLTNGRMRCQNYKPVGGPTRQRGGFGSVLTEGNYRIDSRGAPGRSVAGHQRRAEE